MSLVKKFNNLMSHLNSEDNELAEEFRDSLATAERVAKDDAEWRAALEAGGVDNWEWYGDCFFHDEEVVYNESL